MAHPFFVCVSIYSSWIVVFLHKGNLIILYRNFTFLVLSITKQPQSSQKGIVIPDDKKTKLSFIVLYPNISSNWIPFRTILDPCKPCPFQNAWIAYNAYLPSSAQIQLPALSVAGFCVSSPLQTLVAGRLPFYMHSVYGWHIWFCCLWISCRDFQADIHHIVVLYIM